MLQSLRCCYPIVCVVDKKLFNQIDDLGARLRDQFCNAGAFDASEPELSEVHVARVALELVKQLLIRCPQDVMDLVHLVELVIAGEEREQGDHFEHDASDAPQVHLVAIVSICEQAFWCTIPPGGDVFCVGLL